MDMITISAKTLDEAITKALLELQTTSEHLYYEIVQKETSGVFGIFGAKPCILRVRVMSEGEEKVLKREAAEKEKAEKEQREREKKEEKEKTETENTFVSEEKRHKMISDPSREDQEKETRLENTGGERRFSDRKGYERKRSERRGEKRRERYGRRNYEFRLEKQDETEKPVREEKPRQPVKADSEKVQNAAKDFLKGVFGAMGMEVSVDTALNLEEGDLQIMLSGEDMGILIGKRGQTLDSLQYLTSLVVNKETEGYLRVKLDTENYRERRKETLEILARNISYKVKRTKHPVSLEPMNPYERRIIHSTLQNDRYVMTRSEGVEPYRHVVIFLKNDRYSGRRDQDRFGSRRDRERERSFDGRSESEKQDAAAENHDTEAGKSSEE